MKTIILILVFFLTPDCISQETDVRVYLPSGKELDTGEKVVREIIKDFEPKGMVSSYILCESCDKDKVMNIYFKFLTTKPLFIITDKPKCIKQCIDSYDFTYYMRSFLSEMDIERYVEKKVLTDIYLLKTLGLPDKKPKDVTVDRTFELWYYYKYNLVFKILNSYVVGYIRPQ